MALTFAQSTEKILKALPRVWKMRRDPSSVGAQFLNVVGLTLDDLYAMLDYAEKSTFIGTNDITQLDIIYKATLPQNIKEGYSVAFYGNGFLLEKVEDLAGFFAAQATREYSVLNFKNVYLVDDKRNVVYVRLPYDKDTDHPEGRITMILRDQQGRLIVSEDLTLSIHHVWNFFDEFGLLLNTPRFYGETNADYKERLLDVFRHPANSSRQGLINGIGRDLGLLHKKVWLDASKNYTIQETMVVDTSIQIDGINVDPTLLTIDESGRFVVLGRTEWAEQTKRITYVAGISIHELHNKSDTAFQNELYTVDNQASPMLQYYVDIITSRVPIMWGHFVWNEGFWDIANTDMSGYGFIPVFYDAQFSGWRNYTP